MKKIVLLIVTCLFMSLVYDSFGQMNRNQIRKNNRRLMTYRGKKFGFGKEKRYNSIGITLSALNYYGDLSPRPNKLSTDFSFTRPAIGLSFSHRFGPRYSLVASFTYGGIRGSDAESADKGDTKNGLYRYQRNLSFRNRIKELSVVAVFDLFENQSTYISRAKWTPYAFAGIAVFHHNPEAQVPATQLDGTPFSNAGEWVKLQPLGTEGQNAALLDTDANHGTSPYKLFQIAIPFGIGARFRLNEVMDLSFELGFRYLFTDYLDDVSKNYVDLGVFGNNELAKALSYRTNELNIPTDPPYIGRDGVSYDVVNGYGREYKSNLRGSKSDKDTYTVTTLKFTYIIGKTFHRAKFR